MPSGHGGSSSVGTQNWLYQNLRSKAPRWIHATRAIDPARAPCTCVMYGSESVDERHQPPRPAHVRRVVCAEGLREHRLLRPHAVAISAQHGEAHEGHNEAVAERDGGAQPDEERAEVAG